MYSIGLPQAIIDDVIDHAQHELPNECCGYITGQNDRCKTLYKMTNVEASPDYFEFAPKEQFQVIKTARKNNEIPLVVYHSHPESPARLSQKDLELLTDPEMVYLIVSLKNKTPDLKAFRIIDQKIFNVMIDTKEENYVN
tara:strand:- start:8453 stop:8872 length:420 start_codon:yes stop_codon:yes gene_type:complete